MSVAKERPYFRAPTDYEDDFYAWSYEQAALLRLKRFGELDLTNLVEEVESLGREQRRALRSSYRLLIAHLLKWQFQPDHQTRSWSLTIVRERENILDREQENPSLKADAEAIMNDAYRGARREAMAETGLPKQAFPPECPYTLAQLHDEDFMPE